MLEKIKMLLALISGGGGVDAGCKEVTHEGASTASILLRIQRVQLKYHYALWFRVHEFCYRNAIGNRKRDGISIPFRPEQRSYLSALSALLKRHYIQTNLLGWLLGELGDKQLTTSERGWAVC